MIDNRTPLTALLAVLVLLVAGPVAQADTATVDDAAAEERAAPGYQVKAVPDVLRLQPGSREAIEIVASARADTRLEVHLAEDAKGIHVKMDRDGLKAHAGQRDALRVLLAADANAEPGERVLRFVVASADSERQEIKVIVHVVEKRPTDEGPAFGLRVEPDVQRARPGEAAVYKIVAHAKRAATLHLGVDGLPRGYEARIEPETLTLAAGERGVATLTLVAAEGAPSETFLVVAKSADGDGRAAAKARLEVIRERPAPAPTPAETPVCGFLPLADDAMPPAYPLPKRGAWGWAWVAFPLWMDSHPLREEGFAMTRARTA